MFKNLNKKEEFNKLYLECEIITWIVNADIYLKDPFTEILIKERGNLYINSKSLLFVPDGDKLPIYRFRYRNIQPDSLILLGESVKIRVRELVEVKRDGPPSNNLFFYFKKNNDNTILINFNKKSKNEVL